MSEMKLIMESWQSYVNEQQNPQDPTVGDFLETWNKQSPRSIKKIFGKLAKFVVGVGVGVGTSAAAGSATGGLGTALGVTAGAAAGKTAEVAMEKVFDWIAGQGGTQMAQFLANMADNQVPDDQRTGLALYYDLDDEYEALLQGMDSELANKYQKELFKYFKRAFTQMDGANPDEPLSKYISMTANQYLQRFLQKKTQSGVGVVVRPVKQSTS